MRNPFNLVAFARLLASPLASLFLHTLLPFSLFHLHSLQLLSSFLASTNKEKGEKVKMKKGEGNGRGYMRSGARGGLRSLASATRLKGRSRGLIGFLGLQYEGFNECILFIYYFVFIFALVFLCWTGY